MSILSDKHRVPPYFLPLLLGFGLLYVFLIPPFQSPDEPNHFLRSWDVSFTHLWPQKTSDHRLGDNLPAGLERFIHHFDTLRKDPQHRITFTEIWVSDTISISRSNQKFQDFANTAVYAPTAYFPQSLAIKMGFALGWGPLWILYAARCLNLGVWIFLWYGAIRLFRFQKTGFSVLALLPASLVLAASVNADVITNGLSIWVFAALLFGSNAVFWGSILALLVVSINKLVTLPLVLLLWIREPQNHKKNLFITVFIGMAAFGWATYANQNFVPYDAYHPAFRDTQTLNEGVNPNAQLHWVLGHPLQFSDIVIKSYVQALPSTTAHWVGKFGWEKNYMPFGWIAALLGLLAFLAISEKNNANRSQRGMAAVIIGLYLVLFSVTMYALWMPLAAPVLGNLQGRYFVPVLPLLLYAIGNQYIKVNEKWQVTLVVLLTIGSNLAMLYAIWIRYYHS